MAKLLINKGSWHYRYWTFLRGIWGFTNYPDQTSLCPYCQTMIWLSVLTVVMSPVLVIGWLISKGFRFGYGKLERQNWGKKITDAVDWLEVSEIFDRLPYDRSPALAAFTSFMITAGIALFAFVACGVGSMGIWFFPEILSVLLSVVMHVGWSIFWILGVFGLIAVRLSMGVVWLGTAGWLWLAVVNVALWILGFIAACVAVGYAVSRAWNSETGKKFSEWVSFRFNGYKEARHAAKSRRIELAEAIREGKVAPPPPSFCDKIKAIASSYFAPVRWVYRHIHDFFFSTEVDWKGGAAKCMSPIAIAWQFAVSVKHGICPLVEFVDAEKIEEAQVCYKLTVIALHPETQIKILRGWEDENGRMKLMASGDGLLHADLAPDEYTIYYVYFPQRLEKMRIRKSMIELTGDLTVREEPTPEQPEESQPEEPKPEEPKPEEPKPEESQPEESQPEEPKPEESQPEEPKPEESQPEESQPEEPKPEESQPEEQPEVSRGEIVKPMPHPGFGLEQ